MRKFKRWYKWVIATASFCIMTIIFYGETYAAEMQSGMAAIQIEANEQTTVVGFGGHEWWVIGYDGNGVNSSLGNMTLLSKHNDFGKTMFDNDENRNNVANSNYGGSLLQKEMEAIYQGEKSPFTKAEKTFILPRELDEVAMDQDGKADDILTGDHYVWPLSRSEFNRKLGAKVLAYGDSNWLRTSNNWKNYSNRAWVAQLSGGDYAKNTVINQEFGIRPALTLDVSSILFTSSSVDGKSLAVVGNGLQPTIPTKGTIKFTMLNKDDAPKITLAELTNGTNEMRFGFYGAATGKNQYLSVVLEQNDDVKYYGKLADCSTSDHGMAKLNLNGMPAGTYDLKIFSEQANDDLYMDVASKAVNVSLKIDADGKGTIADNAIIDGEKPMVENVVPDGIEAQLNGTIDITFHELMNTTDGIGMVSLNQQTALSKGQWIDGKTYSVPYKELKDKTIYQISISGFQDIAGNEMEPVINEYSFTAAKHMDRTLNDPSGVIVKGKFSHDVELSVKENVLHDDGTCIICDEILNQQKMGKLIVLYDITLVSGDYEGDLEVSIPVDAKYNGQIVNLVHCKNNISELRQLMIKDGYANGTFSTLSPFAVVKLPDEEVLDSGLPENHTMYVGDVKTWTPTLIGGEWTYDKEYLALSQDGENYTFKALKVGKTSVTYIIDEMPFTIEITIQEKDVVEAETPNTSDTTNSSLWIMLMMISFVGCRYLVKYHNVKYKG